MKIQKTINLDIEKTGKILSIGDSTTLQLVMGTTSVIGNIHMYQGLKKVGSRWEVPIQTVRKQLDRIKGRIKKDQARADIISQVLGCPNK